MTVEPDDVETAPPPRRPRACGRQGTSTGTSAMAKEWFPHEYVPWSDGRDFDGLLGGEPWSPEQSKIPGRRAHRADRQPAHRGQPAQLPLRDRHALRPRRRLGHLGAPLDRRGGPPRRRHPRLPHGHPRRRPGRARAGPHGAHEHRLRGRRRRRCCTRWPTSPSRSSPPASRTATPAAPPATRSASSCCRGSRPTRTCT